MSLLSGNARSAPTASRCSPSRSSLRGPEAARSADRLRGFYLAAAFSQIAAKAAFLSLLPSQPDVTQCGHPFTYPPGDRRAATLSDTPSTPTPITRTPDPIAALAFAPPPPPASAPAPHLTLQSALAMLPLPVLWGSIDLN